MTSARPIHQHPTHLEGPERIGPFLLAEWVPLLLGAFAGLFCFSRLAHVHLLAAGALLVAALLVGVLAAFTRLGAYTLPVWTWYTVRRWVLRRAGRIVAVYRTPTVEHRGSAVLRVRPLRSLLQGPLRWPLLVAAAWFVWWPLGLLVLVVWLLTLVGRSVRASRPRARTRTRTEVGNDGNDNNDE